MKKYNSHTSAVSSTVWMYTIPTLQSVGYCIQTLTVRTVYSVPIPSLIKMFLDYGFCVSRPPPAIAVLKRGQADDHRSWAISLHARWSIVTSQRFETSTAAGPLGLIVFFDVDDLFRVSVPSVCLRRRRTVSLECRAHSLILNFLPKETAKPRLPNQSINQSNRFGRRKIR